VFFSEPVPFLNLKIIFLRNAFMVYYFHEGADRRVSLLYKCNWVGFIHLRSSFLLLFDVFGPSFFVFYLSVNVFYFFTFIFRTNFQ